MDGLYAELTDAWLENLRAFHAAVGTAGSPTTLSGQDARYRLSEQVGCLYSEHFETALVKVTLDSGLVGWGEAQAPLAPEVACSIVELLLRLSCSDG